jgi:hypothetical protein
VSDIKRTLDKKHYILKEEDFRNLGFKNINILINKRPISKLGKDLILINKIYIYENLDDIKKEEWLKDLDVIGGYLILMDNYSESLTKVFEGVSDNLIFVDNINDGEQFEFRCF